MRFFPRPTSAWRYAAWDGSTPPIDLEGDEILAALNDDLAYHGDLAAALRRLANDGLSFPDGRELLGLREMLDRLAQRRRELAEGLDPSGIGEHVLEALDEVLRTERAELDRRLVAADAAPSDPQAAATAASARERHTELDLLPDGVGEQISALQDYDFASDEARQRFEELLDELRSGLTGLQLDRAASALAGAGPEEREHLRAGLNALNDLLEARAAGEDTAADFAAFMTEFGDLFPGDPQSLDELIDQLGQRMAAASAFLASLDPGQRAQLESVAEAVMSDMDLAWQVDRLGANLRDLAPRLGWDEAGPRPEGRSVDLSALGEGLDTMSELARLEELLAQASEPGVLAEIDFDRAGELLGTDVAASLRELAELSARLEEAGLASRREGRLELSPAGLRRLGANALAELFARIRRERFGDHPVAVPGLGHDRDPETKPYEFGDPFRLDIERTVRNAITRQAGTAPSSGGVASLLPLELDPQDFEIERSEHLSAASTVLAIDLSLSMPMEDNFLAAKKVALALHSLISSRYPRDYLGLVGFSATAREIRPQDLPAMSWDLAYGTNLQHALGLSRKLLANRRGSKQIIVVTDGEPTAHVREDGEIFFHYPPVHETIVETLREVTRCTRDRILINTFVLNATGGLRTFVDQMTRRNRGRAFFTTPAALGDYILVDFVEHRSPTRRRVRRGA